MNDAIRGKRKGERQKGNLLSCEGRKAITAPFRRQEGKKKKKKGERDRSLRELEAGRTKHTHLSKKKEKPTVASAEEKVIDSIFYSEKGKNLHPGEQRRKRARAFSREKGRETQIYLNGGSLHVSPRKEEKGAPCARPSDEKGGGIPENNTPLKKNKKESARRGATGEKRGTRTAAFSISPHKKRRKHTLATREARKGKRREPPLKKKEELLSRFLSGGGNLMLRGKRVLSRTRARKKRCRS